MFVLFVYLPRRSGSNRPSKTRWDPGRRRIRRMFRSLPAPLRQSARKPTQNQNQAGLVPCGASPASSGQEPMTGGFRSSIFLKRKTRRAPACAGGSPKPTWPGAAPGRRAISSMGSVDPFIIQFIQMGSECRKSARLSCKQQDRECYPTGPTINSISLGTR